MQRRPTASARFELGSAEWVALPGLRLPAVLARIDTGARTSALHATGIEVYAAASGQRVRFITQPVPGRRDIVQACDLPLLARRWVKSSNGARELRCVVATEIVVGGRRWPIEITLTNRARMRYRMLLGRQAILPDMVVVPGGGRRQAALDPERAFGARALAVPSVNPEAVSRTTTVTPLRLGLIGVGPVGPAWQHMADAALARGHLLERIDIRTCRLLQTEAGPRIESGGRIGPPLEAALAFADPAMPANLMVFQYAVLRQAEAAGAVVLNDAAALARCGDPASCLQALWQAGIPVLAKTVTAAGVMQPEMRVGRAGGVTGVVVAGEVLAVQEERPRRRARRPTAEEGRLMVKAAAALGLGLARVNLGRRAYGGPVILDIDAASWLTEPAGSPPGPAALGRVAAAIISALEVRAQARSVGVLP